MEGLEALQRSIHFGHFDCIYRQLHKGGTHPGGGAEFLHDVYTDRHGRNGHGLFLRMDFQALWWALGKICLLCLCLGVSFPAPVPRYLSKSWMGHVGDVNYIC